MQNITAMPNLHKKPCLALKVDFENWPATNTLSLKSYIWWDTRMCEFKKLMLLGLRYYASG